MNETLSSLIAFVGFLIVFSMMIQSVQEALKNLFKLKTGVWERFFINVYKNDFLMSGLKPETPFWDRVWNKPFVGEFELRLKRLKNIIISSSKTLKEVKYQLLEITEMNMDDPDTQKTVVGKIEPLCDQIRKITGLRIESVLDIYDKNKEDIISKTLKDLRAQFSELETIPRSKKINEQAFKDLQRVSKALYDTIRKLETKISTYRMQIESKADAWLAQLDGEYKMNMLKWTLVISTISVVLLNVDAFNIYNHFSMNTKARDLMIANAESALSGINKIQPDNLNGINMAIQNKKTETALKESLLLSSEMATEFEKFNDTANKDKAASILLKLKGIDPKGEAALSLIEGYHGELVALYLFLQKSAINYQMERVAASGLPLGWITDWRAIVASGWSRLLILKKISGLTLTIFLVSFGAPFWQNIMNALIGLRNYSKKTETPA